MNGIGKIALSSVLAAMCIIIFSSSPRVGPESAFAQAKKTLHYFYGVNCPHCQKAAPIVDRLAGRYNLRVVKLEVYNNKANLNKLLKMGKERGKRVQGVPTIVIGRAVYTGTSAEKIEAAIRGNLK